MNSYDVFVLGGQSNGEGRGRGEGNLPVVLDPVLWEYSDPYPFGMRQQKDGSYRLLLHTPPAFVLKPFEEETYPEGEGHYACLFPGFANAYRKAGYLPEGRKILLVKAAVDGTGFYWDGQWGRHEPLSDRLLSVTQDALKLGDCRLVAFLWHQGEHEAFERPNLSMQERHDDYYAWLKELFDDFRAQFGNVPIICGEGTKQWEKEYASQCQAVWSATKEVLSSIGNGAFVTTEELLSNDEVVHNGDVIHFSRLGQEALGERYFNAWRRLAKQ